MIYFFDVYDLAFNKVEEIIGNRSFYLYKKLTRVEFEVLDNDISKPLKIES